MKKLLILFALIVVSCTLWAQNNVITYTASAKLEEVTENFSHGLNINAFDVNIVSHTFADSTGIITFEGEVTNIGDRAFYRCYSLTSITIPESVTSIGNYAFFGCSSLTSITIPESVEYIARYAFEGCTSLPIIDKMRYADTYLVQIVDKFATTYTIQAFTRFIGDTVFWKCDQVTHVNCLAPIPPLMSSRLELEYAIPIYVPEESVDLYRENVQWRDYNIQPLLVTTDSIAADTTQLSWMPVDSASMYQLRIYSEQIGLDTTLYIAADSTNGGISKILAPTQRRAHRVTMDAGGSVIIITIEPNSGTTTTTPFVVTVSTSSSEKIDVQFEMIVLQGSNILREEVGSFTLNKDNRTGLESVFYPTSVDTQRCYDIYGHSYHKPQWNSLPTGIYVIRNGGTTMKVLKTQ